MVDAAMVLCAGLGTRLRPLTNELAKPMVPVGDRPAVGHVLARVRRAALSRIVLNVHHRPDDLRAWAEEERVAISEEPDLLGTAGGVRQAAKLIGEGDVLVWNGDILSDLDPHELLTAHLARDARVCATLAVHARPSGQGNVGFDDAGRIVRLRAERLGIETRGGDFLGIHVITEGLRALCPAQGCLVGDVYLPALRRGERLDVFITSAPFRDIGSIAQYLAANEAWLASRNLTSWAHPTAKVHASIERSVVGAGATVDAPVRRSVVWPGANVQSACMGAVVTTAGTTVLEADPKRSPGT